MRVVAAVLLCTAGCAAHHAHVATTAEMKRAPVLEAPRETACTFPALLVAILRCHIETQLTTDAMRSSELLFPAEDGRFRSRSALKKPFAVVAEAIGVKKHATPMA